MRDTENKGQIQPSDSEKDELIRSRKKKLKQEWANKEVTLPISNFVFLYAYQAVLPLLIPLFLWYGLLYAWQLYPQYNLLFIFILPLWFLGNYYLYIILLTEMSFWLVNYWCNRKSPPVEGEFPRNFAHGDAEDPRIRYYHVRGFLFKWPTFFTKKSPFPWLQNYVLNRLGENKIHPDAMYMDSFVGLEMIEMGAGTIIGEGTCVSSHIVDSIYGALTIRWIKLGENNIISTNCGTAPGTITGDNISVLPNSFMVKGKTYDREQKYYVGSPAKPYTIPSDNPKTTEFLESPRKK